MAFHLPGKLSPSLYLALFSLFSLTLFLVFHLLGATDQWKHLILLISIAIGGGKILLDLFRSALKGEFAADLIAGVAIIFAVILEEYVAATIVILMLTGGEALEQFAVKRASSALDALARRMPTKAHKKDLKGSIEVSLDTIEPGDLLLVFPHEVCPVDGVVIEGKTHMDEAYLTGEPFVITKVPGSQVISGALNGDGLITIQALKKPKDSRYAKIVEVMKRTEETKLGLRRIGDTLGAFYTPFTLVIASATWITTGSSTRFLAVLVTATPCPLLIGIPVAVVATISLCARRGIVLKDPAVLEQASRCTTIIFDKTGTLTYGEPELTLVHSITGRSEQEILQLAASLEEYSRHPLAHAVKRAAEKRNLAPIEASRISEEAGKGLIGIVNGEEIGIVGRSHLTSEEKQFLNSTGHSLECFVTINKKLEGMLLFRDEPRKETQSFIAHLSPRHGIQEILILSGDRETEVRRIADNVGIHRILAGKNPEEKLAVVQEETAKAPTLYVGDGINDAPALTAATVGIAMGARSDVTTEAADAIIPDASLSKVDEFLHITARMRRIALQTGIGGITLSILAMGGAAYGMISPVAGALIQEVIDLVSVMNALRALRPPRKLTDF